MTTISELQERAYQQSKEKGFHDDQPDDPRLLLSRNAERIALMHSELSEALEELRNGRAVNETYYPDDGIISHGRSVTELGMPAKPEGVPSEMADVVIRILDFCGANGIDLETMIEEKLRFNATRPSRHGKKF